MAIGDKLFLADKTTLDAVKAATDTVNTNTADTKTKIGTTTDTGGSATAGTLMGKLNALISSIATHITNWTAARAANLDAAVSSRESEANAVNRYNTLNGNTAVNNTASASGTLSQKLSHIINLLSNNGQKVLASKVITMTVSAPGTHTILNISGSGVFEFAYSSMGYSNSALTFEVDGQAQTFNTEVGYKYFGKSLYSPGSLLYMVPSSSSTNSHFPAMRELYFKESLKITVNKTDSTELFFQANYSIHE